MADLAKHTLDATGLICPMPVIRTQQTVRTLKPGDILIVSVTDPGAVNDIPAWCKVNGHSIVAIDQTFSPTQITIEVNEMQNTVW